MASGTHPPTSANNTALSPNDAQFYFESEQSEGSMEDLRKLQLAHEGMRLLLSSEVKQAEELFRTSRYLGPELNAGYSFVQLVRAIMTFEDDALDFAYKSLESTQKFCETSRKLTRFLHPSRGFSQQDKMSPHERLYRKAIVADCLLFEAILVFLKQGVTSYVKGGYLIRKAWKIYEKLFHETEMLCSQPSPIVKGGVASPVDMHVGTSLYDREGQDDDDELAEEGEEVLSDGGTSTGIHSSLEAVSDTLGSMHFGFGALDGLMVSIQEEASTRVRRSEPATSSLATSSHNSDSLVGGRSKSASVSHVYYHGNPARSHDSHHGNLSPPQPRKKALSINGSAVVNSASSSRSSSRSGSEENLFGNGPTLRGTNEPDGGGRGGKRSKKRPQSGYFLPDITSSLVVSLEHEDTRLRGAVYFGYGLMNIILSMIPPRLLKLANLLGFQGNRKMGLQALEFASNSQDMKAPLARIALLWYHTIVRPFFALDGENEGAGADEAERLIAQTEHHYPNSSLFLYFKGKVFYLRCQLDEALRTYTAAASLAKDQREIEHISLYEKGWIHFLQLDYAQALPCYLRLKNETRWSACYYAYLAAVMSGIRGELKESRELFLQSAKLVKRKNNNLEKFCARRGHYYKRGTTVFMPLEAQLMAIEVIYLWRALPFCTEAVKLQLVDILSIAMPPDAQPFHWALAGWLRGGVLNSLGRMDEAEKSLCDVIGYDSQIKHDKHIISFSLYELAMVHISRDEFARARGLLLLAKEQYSGYEFEARLNYKVHSALALIR